MMLDDLERSGHRRSTIITAALNDRMAQEDGFENLACDSTSSDDSY